MSSTNKPEEKWVPESPQQFIVDQIKNHKAIPVLSNSISNDLILGDHRQLIIDFAEYLDYPLIDKDNLAHFTQFVMNVTKAADQKEKGDSDIDALSIKRAYLIFIKKRLCRLAESGGIARGLLNEVTDKRVLNDLDFSEMAKRLGYPRFAESPQDDPLLILASLDLPVYLTTGYHQVMEAALRQSGKRPRTGICRWSQDLEKEISDDIFSGGYEPSPEEPLVYHLHGLDTYPASLVLLEDDHLEFLVAISQEEKRPADRIHPRVREELEKSSLILLGYDLESWEFRTLFWGLLKSRQGRPKKGVSVLHLQIAHCPEERQYIQAYLRMAKFEVFWMSIQEYTKELYQALRA